MLFYAFTILSNPILSKLFSSNKIDAVKYHVKFFSVLCDCNIVNWPFNCFESLSFLASTFDLGLTNHLASNCPGTFDCMFQYIFSNWERKANILGINGHFGGFTQLFFFCFVLFCFVLFVFHLESNR